MDRHIPIKNFVQSILGCTCPDKVFEQIEDRQVASSSSPHNRSFTIGGRLLVYVWNIKGSDKLEENLLAMLEAGRRERDERGLNRFRAVLAADAPQDVATQAHLYFSKYGDKDDRMHLHVVSSNDLRDI